MSYVFERRGDVIFVIYTQEVAAEDTAEIRRKISDEPEVGRIVFNLTGVELITTPGLGALLAIHKHCIEKEKKLVLFGLSPYVKEIFSLTRLSRIFDIRDSESDSLKG